MFLSWSMLAWDGWSAYPFGASSYAELRTSIWMKRAVKHHSGNTRNRKYRSTIPILPLRSEAKYIRRLVKITCYQMSLNVDKVKATKAFHYSDFHLFRCEVCGKLPSCTSEWLKQHLRKLVNEFLLVTLLKKKKNLTASCVFFMIIKSFSQT